MSRIAVTTFYTDSYETLAAITIPVLQKYCDKHGYDLHITKSPEGVIHFVKTKDAFKLLEDYDFVWAVENDILITNLNVPLENFIDESHDFFICKDVNGYNGGSFIIKKNVAKFLILVNSYEGKEEDEQTVFNAFCSIPEYGKYIKTLEHPSINSIPYDPYYEPTYGYYNNPNPTKPTEEQGCWFPGNFTCHLPGLTLEKRIEIFNQIKTQIIW